jgi:hypothetical protein
VATLLAITFLLGCFPMSDFDVWWHLRTGQLILASRHLPRVDMLTYTNAGRPWIDLYWLFQIAIASLYRLGGVNALVLFKASAGTLVVALALRARAARAPLWPAVLVWLPAVVALSGRLCERPELISLVLVAAFLLLLAHAATRPRGLWLLPVLEVIWVNCHGFFVLGPFLLLAYWTEALYRLLWRGREIRGQSAGQLAGQADGQAGQAGTPPLRTLTWTSLATLAACLASPYGWGALALPIEQFHKLGDAGLYRTSVGELATLGDFIAGNGFTNPYLLSLFALFGLGLVSFALQLRRRGPRLGPRISPFRLILFAAASYLGWQATRNSALFALMVATVTCWNLDDVVLRSRAAVPRAPGKVARTASSGSPRRRRIGWLFACLVLFGLFVASGALYAWGGEGRTVGLGERRQWYAHGACAFLARPDLPERIVAFNMSQAAVCIAHVSPAHRLFLDPRLEVNTRATFEHYLQGFRRLWHGDADWESPLGIDYGRPDELPALLVERGPLIRAAYTLAADPRWRCVFADAVAVVFVPTWLAEARGLTAVPDRPTTP